ncbi:MAG: ATP-dependent DNA helicase PcrA [Candidatus Moranbacteria bacterium GW2011_GWE2_35_2-]|nr:MAG: ATP-dependent DNA helicase PcrA [Candidatus Moranbacteria bacterium GW2011_GWE2_35_2-]KKQ04285.1 MAG: ATP-dependent DNA helicase PcrA [Candidatus Moranbacteria bacterium GW2011_GWF1_36_4]KKQ22603.1 MAG: ATP-dependent DNA helicase PcrA [Candidatus Moranbacteria bacterium GW2011_GWF2_37_11]KKQ29006.1 MAG: ATP-dependent DNA helicase PcrA [Candidatus Moranbacteria bacterium GW2011_GWD1_37_17]KKQ30458.1 MAG: ATP-dependent DNA helicase PcrA [Candidatus Moranbacteria bacterium GW2011_GWE1_37_2
MNELLKELNSAQREAVQATEGPVLVIAGAGSGKTRVLTHRVAYLISEKGVKAQNILAVTFTNKAAQEMKERISQLITSNNLPNVGTFHSICVKILRREIDKLGYKKSFNIFDDQDQKVLMKKIVKELEINTEQFIPNSFLGIISKAKNELRDEYVFESQIGGYYEEIVAKVYKKYQKELRENNALDFDDLIRLTIEIFQKFPDILEKYQRLFQYILVDEYQDTNHAQYTFVRLLAQKHCNLCVVGDDWQSIYGWRQADIRNILNFEKDYPEAKVIKLEQNYRSTQIILDAAYGVISQNVNRKDKKVWTENKGGHLITSFEAEDEREEAEYVANEIKNFISNPPVGGQFSIRQSADNFQKNSNNKIRNFKHQEVYNYSSFAVLYRTNAQSRAIEESFLRNNIPYRIIGGLKFYQRKEIKDMIAYLRLIQNGADYISLERVINEPKRGIGKATLSKWIAYAKKNGKNFISVGLNLNKDCGLNDSKIESITKFCEFIERMREYKGKIKIADFIEKVFIESGYEKSLSNLGSDGEIRIENIRELLSVAGKYGQELTEQMLELFLEEVALASDTDKIEQRENSVHLMTLHSAKGLEFPVVFIVGLEEGILPHSRSMLGGEEMEEERRLMYVGITRAMQRVYLIFTHIRMIFGSNQANPPSRFLNDIPAYLVNNNQDIIIDSKKNNLESQENDDIKKQQSVGYKDGQRVKHKEFGEGVIISISGDTATVVFPKRGIKRLPLLSTPLSKM